MQANKQHWFQNMIRVEVQGEAAETSGNKDICSSQLNSLFAVLTGANFPVQPARYFHLSWNFTSLKRNLNAYISRLALFLSSFAAFSSLLCYALIFSVAILAFSYCFASLTL